MPETATDQTTGTVKLHRVFKTTPEKLYKAFVDPDAMVKWLPPHGFTGKVHSSDIRVGGGYHMSFTNFGTGNSHSFRCEYVELTPHSKIRYIDQFPNTLEQKYKRWKKLPNYLDMTLRCGPMERGSLVVI